MPSGVQNSFLKTDFKNILNTVGEKLVFVISLFEISLLLIAVDLPHNLVRLTKILSNEFGDCSNSIPFWLNFLV